MKFLSNRIAAVVFALLVSPLFVVTIIGQSASKAPGNDLKAASEIRSSPAYAELLLKKAELQAELEALAVEYTEEFPKVAEGRYTLELIEKERARMLAVKPAEAGKLSLSLGKLITRKIDLEVELWTLRKTLQEAHPDVKRAKKKVEIFEAAIKEILG